VVRQLQGRPQDLKFNKKVTSRHRFSPQAGAKPHRARPLNLIHLGMVPLLLPIHFARTLYQSRLVGPKPTARKGVSARIRCTWPAPSMTDEYYRLLRLISTLCLIAARWPMIVALCCSRPLAAAPVCCSRSTSLYDD
jgi:hypothetical protein